MNAQDYQKLRRSIGTQEEVAKALDIHRMTLNRRENGATPITREIELAILSLKPRQK